MTQKDQEQHNAGQVFNMSLATLTRIDVLLSTLNHPIISRNPAIRTNTIQSLYMELYPFLHEDEMKEGDQILLEIHRKYNGIIPSTVEETVFGKMATFEFWIRRKLNEKGLLMAKPDDPGIALGRS